MYNSINELTECIFKDMPYSKVTDDIKAEVTVSLTRWYDHLRQSGKSELQAMGYIMDNYGTPIAAAALVERKLPEPADDMYEEKGLKKLFRKVRLLSFIIAFLFCFASISFIDSLMYFSPIRIAIVLLFYLALTIIPALLYKKKLKIFNYDNICLLPKAKNRFFSYLDKYKKCSLNCVLILVCAIVFFISRTFERASLGNMNGEELLVLANMNYWIIEVALFFLFYYSLNLIFSLQGCAKKSRTSFYHFLIGTLAAAFIFLAVGGGGVFVCGMFLGNFLDNPYPVLYLLTFIFVPIDLIIIISKRKAYVDNNRISRKAVAFIMAIVIVFLTVSRFRQDVYVLQPYIMGVSGVRHTDHTIVYDARTGEYTIVAGDEDFKILHLTDIHIGGSVISSYKDYQALEACRRLIEHTKPDFVIVTGDMSFPMGIMSFSLNNTAPVIQFASFMRNIGIPWAFTYGNHDTESVATADREAMDTLFKSLSYKTSGNLLYPYVKPDITGRCNQLIKIENPDGSIRQALFLIDSNDYTGVGINDYDYIHDDQVDWYAEQVEKLSEMEGRIVPSMIFFHIPLQEYRTAYNLYEAGSDEVEYYFGVIGETMIDKICCSDYPSRLFDTAVSLGSTKAMFCGHDHYNNISLKYRGIRLTYGMSIDYLAMPGISRDTAQRGAEVITIRADSSFDVEQVPLEGIK